jgi:psiF repeat-containing protein
MKRFVRICATVLSLALVGDLATPSSAFALFGKSKEAISKSCSQQADKKGLHGKARKAFRAKCKRHGGKST